MKSTSQAPCTYLTPVYSSCGRCVNRYPNMRQNKVTRRFFFWSGAYGGEALVSYKIMCNCTTRPWMSTKITPATTEEAANTLRVCRGGGGLGEGPGGRACSIVACLSHLTIDHAYFSRRSTFPTLVGTPPTLRRCAQYVYSMCYIMTFCLSFLLPGCPSAAIIYLLG